MVIHKRKAWKGIMLDLIVIANHQFVFTKLVNSDKMLTQVRMVWYC